jgi:hypothetical protein
MDDVDGAKDIFGALFQDDLDSDHRAHVLHVAKGLGIDK